MEKIDKIIFGDNQFFGINHMSQEKAQQLAEKFYKIENIFQVYNYAIDAGVKGIMLNSNERAKDIVKYFKDNQSKYNDLNWYPSIPYPYKYANMVAEQGIPQAINELLVKGQSMKSMFGMIAKGGSAVLTKDVVKLMQILIDMEMKMFEGLNIKVVFLQNIITDLLLGYDFELIFKEYTDYIRKKYNAIPGLITQNMPVLLDKLKNWNIEQVVVCSSFNKIGYLMSPGIEAYIKASQENDPEKYQLMAMSTLASGAIPPKEAYDFINQQNIQSVVFGASSRNHIVETVKLITNE